MIDNFGHYFFGYPFFFCGGFKVKLNLIDFINSLNFAVHNRKVLTYWWLAAVVSIVQFMLAAIILASLPFSALITVGLLLSVDFIFSGLTLLGLSSTCKYVVSRE